jgi:hypothetical protein
MGIFIVIDLWKKLPDQQRKDLNIFSFSKKLKPYLLTQQYYILQEIIDSI